ncbi:hypothetical protein Glove_395g25 [Diversispora epigaea]|uniref:Uncharacterized protein n=1 Tax=Diversispora epigaea TaxID=1348612 RepID=A0A397H5R0_9GLOM|nr:hypothetical protein Glove_395g25 [Diversispora epigaea]
MPLRECTCMKIQQFLREISTSPNTPIEPPEQTRLFDSCMKIPGVILAGVLMLEDLRSLGVGPLLANESSE